MPSEFRFLLHLNRIGQAEYDDDDEINSNARALATAAVTLVNRAIFSSPFASSGGQVALRSFGGGFSQLGAGKSRNPGSE